MTVLGIIWFFLVFVLIAGYFVLDGFDLGCGVLSPFVAKTPEEKALVRRSIGPVWDGNEVWLLTAGGALFAAFAPAYATTFSGFYLAVFLVLAGLIVRAVAVEYASHDPAWRELWEALFFVGSLLPALLLGVAVGNVYAGIPLDANGDYIGVPLLGLVTPFTLLCGLLGLSLFILQGAGWLSLKAPAGSDVQTRSLGARRIFAIASLVLFVAVFAYANLLIPVDMAPELAAMRLVFLVVFLAALAFALFKGIREGATAAAAGGTAAAAGWGDLAAFIASSLACVALVALWACSMFPNFVVSGSGDPLSLFVTQTLGESITVATAAGSDLALGWMLGIACVGVPLVIIYHIIVYRAFRGRLDTKDVAACADEVNR